MLSLADLLRVPQADTDLPFDISPDRQNVAFAWNKTGTWEIYELPIRRALDKWHEPVSAREHGTRASLLCGGTKLAGAKFAPQYSPNGKLFAYTLDPDESESYHIILHERGTNSHIDLTPNCSYAHQPNFAFSPDGRMLAILSDECGQFALYLLSIETREKKLLLDIHHFFLDRVSAPVQLICREMTRAALQANRWMPVINLLSLAKVLNFYYMKMRVIHS